MNLLFSPRQNERKIRVLVTSRPQLSAKDGLNSAKVISIHAHRSDIELYIRTEIEHKHYHRLLEEQIVTKLLERADEVYYPGCPESSLLTRDLGFY